MYEKQNVVTVIVVCYISSKNFTYYLYGNLTKIRHCAYFRQSHVRHVVSILTDMSQH
jgi:hypothetical protein